MSKSTPPLANLSAIKLALMAKQVREQADTVLRAEPIAIIGMGCRFPGGADSPDAYWQLLRDGVDAVSEVPPDRWDVDAFFDPDLAAAGKSATRSGGFLRAIDGFDAGYFGILGREADAMDPQQRLFLEVAIEALEHAGIPHDQLAGSRAGAFIASYHSDYAQLQLGDLNSIDARTLTGTLHSVLANRLSYLLDLRGPSVSIDTACSSSLVAVHLACQSLRVGDSDVALAGGVSLMITPNMMVTLSKVGFMSPGGHCRTFDANADGFARGEGCGVVVLKRLSDAIAAGDRVLAVIRGSAVNQDGHSTLLAAPNGIAQQALLRDALASAQLEPSRIGYVEAHGTGTPLGDPIEVEALSAVIGALRVDGSRCVLGSAKANLGHLEAAAGVAGLIKTVLVLEHGEIPRQLHFTALNPHLSLADTCLSVADTVQEWPRGAVPRCAGVSGFGVGGTNAHVILEEAPVVAAAPTEVDPATTTRRLHLLALSAKSPAALQALASAWVDFLPTTSASIEALAMTAGARRTHFDYRLAAVGSSVEEWSKQLQSFAASESAPSFAVGRRPPNGAVRLAFVFSGQGPQWFGMGRELLHEEPVFRDVLMDCDARLRVLAGWSLVEELARSESTSRLDQTEIAQPALFAIQVALAALWKSWGIVPDGVVGHSVGEIAALHVAGVLSLDQALRVVWQRGRIMQQATGAGRMAAVGLTFEEADDVVRPFDGRLSVAAINGPRNTVLSGDPESLEQALGILARRGVSSRALPVQYAFHSSQMTPFQRALVVALHDGTLGDGIPDPNRCRVYSTVTGRAANGERFDAEYFGRNVREPVRLAPALLAMLDDGFGAFVEIGPHPVLGSAIAECVAERGIEASILASLRRGRPERATMLQACAGLYAVGHTPRWKAIGSEGSPVVDLPPYPWQRARHWIDARPTVAAPRVVDGVVTGHPLLGRRIRAASQRIRIFEGEAHADSPRWLADHRVFGRVALAGAGMVELLRAAAADLLGPTLRMEAVTIHAPLILPEGGDAPIVWQVTASVQSDDRIGLELHASLLSASEDREWRLIATATAMRTSDSAAQSFAHAFTSPASAAVQSVDTLYATLAQKGFEFGPAFRSIEKIRLGSNAAEGWISAPVSDSDRAKYGLHPALLDGVFQLCTVAAGEGIGANQAAGSGFVPIGVDRVLTLGALGGRARAVVRVSREGAGATFMADAYVEREDGTPAAAFEGIRFAPADVTTFANSSPREAANADVYETAWVALPRSVSGMTGHRANAAGNWLVLMDRSGTGQALVDRLRAEGGQCVCIAWGDALARTADDSWIVDPANPEHLAAVLAETAQRHEGIRGVIHLWGLDISKFDARSGLDRDRDECLGTGSALHLVQALVRQGDAPPPLWFVTRGGQTTETDTQADALRPAAAATWGLAGAVAAEHPELACRLIDLDPEAPITEVDPLVAELLMSDAAQGVATRVALRGTTRLAPRVRRRQADQATKSGVSVSDARPVRLEAVRPGTLDGLAIREVSVAAPGRDEVRVSVAAMGLNFRDVLVALGEYPDRATPLGVECAGTVIEVGAAVKDFAVGDSVFGFAPASMATEVTVPAQFLVRVPPNITIEQAAALAIPFLTAWYGLHHLAELRSGERLLVHAGAGGVGMAAIQLALRAGAHVFATAGTPEKRARLIAMGVAGVFDSRSLDFAKQLMAQTNGAGVDVVLNSLTRDFIPASLDVLAPNGRFLELGKRDVWTSSAVAHRRPDVRYFVYDLGAAAHADRTLVRPMLDALVAALADGSLQPLPIETFAFDDAQHAFRHMAQARHIGKIVLRARRESPPHHNMGALAPDVSLVRNDASYWITGGFGALGLRTARWLAGLGARHIVLSGRNGPSAVAKAAIGECEALGATVHVKAGVDASNEMAMRNVASAFGAALPPLRGVIHTAGVVDDGVLVNQTLSRARTVLRGKAHGAHVLHTITREHPLDFFVLYAAAATVLGPAGQGTYAAANAELEALAHARRCAGLPALSVAWGMWEGGGMAADAALGHTGWGARGLNWLQSQTAFEHLEKLLRDRATSAIVLSIDWPRFLSRLPAGVDRTVFADVSTPSTQGARSVSVAASEGGAVLAALREAPASRRRETIIDHLRERALRILGLDATTAVDEHRPLKDLGLDSLMAVELRNALTRSLGQSLPVTLLFDYPTLDALATYVIRTFRLDESRPAAVDSRRAPSSAAVAALSEEEAEALLLKELEAK